MIALRPALATILQTVDPREKAALTRSTVAEARRGWECFDPPGDAAPWPDPAVRDRPPLRSPTEMPKRGLGSVQGRVALLHAVCHIELNAIDLAVDMAGRFGPTLAEADQRAFILDWLQVADDEARHFVMIADRLHELGASYGDLPAHNGLWQAAARTHDDLMGRLVIAPMVLEARGLDVTPLMIDKLRRNRDEISADLLLVIFDEEIGHVATGSHWFRHLCALKKIAPDETFHAMVEAYFPGGLKRPFNEPARTKSGVPRDWYEGLAAD
ncbi:ferritin-like domain-containing protein [Parvularcula sp. LCG005]|uniref:ferritin-like domain-containing protein n=1 Tax=Parvularcula sp. LCG005 TaxID=3078805 RepID=UPI002941CA10|nr:ferritin-like domain-containing protein [Parvularcula sp. LCG005]WOI54110.1 ferritin-like domain-containing protein [Parvularcula sp. LCG005]